MSLLKALGLGEEALPGLAMLRMRQGTPRTYQTLSDLVSEVPADMPQIEMIRQNFDRILGGATKADVQRVLESSGYIASGSKKEMLDVLRSILERRAISRQQTSVI